MTDGAAPGTEDIATVAEAAELFHRAVHEESADEVLWEETLLGLPVEHFPARGGRPQDPLRRAAMLRLLRSTVADLVSRPDLRLDGRAWFHQPADSSNDLDLVYDVLVRPGDLDFGDRPAAALCRFALHRNFGFGVDADGIYIGQRVMVAVELGGREPDLRLLAATLSLPIDAEHTLTELPGSDVRDDLDGLRERIWREHVWRVLAVDAQG